MIQGKTVDEIHSDEVKRIEAKKNRTNKIARRRIFAMHSGRVKLANSTPRFGGTKNPKLIHVKRKLTFDN